MEGLVLLLVIYTIVYLVYILRLAYGFTKIKTFSNTFSAPQTTFSIIIPFRNEAQQLPNLLDSIKNLNYPKELFEIILVDDFSEDDSQRVIYKWRMENGIFNTTLLENVRISGSPKKDAISRAVPIVANKWIISTDADCTVPATWLSTFNDYIVNNDASMVAGAVIYDSQSTFLHHFQQMDLMALQGATIGSFGLDKAFMCNGANFAYTKELFVKLGGFSGNGKLASGDDVFLLQKAAAEQSESVHYLKSQSAIVVTNPVNSWKQLFYQRVRWASKSVAYENEFGELLAVIVFLGNACIATSVFLTAFGYLPFGYLLALFLSKIAVDTILLALTNGFLRKGKFFFPLFSGLVYPFFSVAVALYSIYGKYEWKGRMLK